MFERQCYCYTYVRSEGDSVQRHKAYFSSSQSRQELAFLKVKCFTKKVMFLEVFAQRPIINLDKW